MLPASSNRGGSTSSRRGGNPEAPATHQAAAIFPAGRQHIKPARLSASSTTGNAAAIFPAGLGGISSRRRVNT